MKTSDWIKNYDAIATTENRKKALSIATAGLDAIDTEHVISTNIFIKKENGTEKLFVKNASYDLSKFKSIHLVGFGKVVCEATVALEKILGNRLKSGIVIGTEKAVCGRVESFAGSHPMPSNVNVKASHEIVTLSESLREDDLAIVVVSGGGSSLLCFPQSECDQGQKLYTEFLQTGGNIEELNTIRKHISQIKGGGLAKMLYPATVIGLIFSDVPGEGDGVYNAVASGPTYPDSSTIADAEKILTKYGLHGYTLNETEKDHKYFEKVTNVCMVSNRDALEGMAHRGRELGYSPIILSDSFYDSAEKAVEKMFATADTSDSHNKKLILLGGEPKIEVPAKHGIGGRNEHASLIALQQFKIDTHAIFISLASDGHDNNMAAGAVADRKTLEKATSLGLSSEKYITDFDAYSFFEKTGDLIITGLTETNVSDLMILLVDSSNR